MQSITAKLPTVARLFLGLVFTVFGLNGFLNFLPMPQIPEAAGAFLGALGATGYMFPLIKATEVVAGVLLLSNRFVPLALTLLAPVVVNIALFHAVLDAPQSMVMPVILVAALAYLGRAYRAAFAPMLQARTEPAQATAAAPTGSLARA